MRGGIRRGALYVVSSDGGPGIRGDKHFANAFLIDLQTGTLSPHGEPAALPSRPIHASVDRSGGFLLTAYNNPSSLTVHRLGTDGTIGAQVTQPPDLDTGIYAHQILATPSNRCVVLVTRGNNATASKPEEPGAIKTFAFENGVLRNLASIAPRNGLGFGPRHLDFHPTKPWAFISIERQNKLYVYALDEAAGLARDPLFVKGTLSNAKQATEQGAGPIHVHANGKFVYLTNRTFPASDGGGRHGFEGGQYRRLRHRPGYWRAETDPAHRRPWRSAAHLRHRCQRTAAGRRQHHAGARCYQYNGWNDAVPDRRRRQACFPAQIRRRSRKLSAILERSLCAVLGVGAPRAPAGQHATKWMKRAHEPTQQPQNLLCSKKPVAVPGHADQPGKIKFERNKIMKR
jgi:hypothetical protein